MQMAPTGCLPEFKDLAKALAVKMCPLNRASPKSHCQTEAVMARAEVWKHVYVSVGWSVLCGREFTFVYVCECGCLFVNFTVSAIAKMCDCLCVFVWMCLYPHTAWHTCWIWLWSVRCFCQNHRQESVKEVNGQCKSEAALGSQPSLCCYLLRSHMGFSAAILRPASLLLLLWNVLCGVSAVSNLHCD